MNSGIFRLVFSAVRGMLVAVDENVDELLGNLTSNVLAGGAGAIAGGGAGALAGASVDRFNRQLDQSERDWAKSNAKDFAKFYEDKTGQKITVEQAQNMLLANGYRLVDAAASKGPGGDSVAVAYISQKGDGLFQKGQAYNDPFKYGNENGSLTPEQAALNAG
ncbi:ESPR-type extended signal peptide-containing protein, partial [Burkholderia stagnalis]